MATDPTFAAAVNVGANLLPSAETNLGVPTQSVTILTAGSNGTKVEEVVIQASATSLTPTTVAGLVYLFIYDGSAQHLFDTITVSAVTASATAVPFRLSTRYSNLILKSGWTLRAAQSIAGNASLLKCIAFGGDL